MGENTNPTDEPDQWDLAELCFGTTLSPVGPPSSLPGTAEPPTNIETVFAALYEIESGWDWAPSLDAVGGGGSPNDPSNYEMVITDRLQWAIRVLSKALGDEQQALMIRVLKLTPLEKGRILARHITARLIGERLRSLPQPAAVPPPLALDLSDPVIAPHLPAKRDVEAALEREHPAIYGKLSKKKCDSGPRLRSAFWNGAGLKDLPKGSGN